MCAAGGGLRWCRPSSRPLRARSGDNRPPLTAARRRPASPSGEAGPRPGSDATIPPSRPLPSCAAAPCAAAMGTARVAAEPVLTAAGCCAAAVGAARRQCRERVPRRGKRTRAMRAARCSQATSPSSEGGPLRVHRQGPATPRIVGRWAMASSNGPSCGLAPPRGPAPRVTGTRTSRGPAPARRRQPVPGSLGLGQRIVAITPPCPGRRRR